LYLVFLWWMVAGNFERALVSFAPQRLVTEGVIFFNAVLCTVGILLSRGGSEPDQPQPAPWSQMLRVACVAGLTAMILSTLGEWGVVRAIYGDQPAGYASKHIRFGPDATATTGRLPAGQPHS